MKRILISLVLLINCSFNLIAQELPILLSPLDGERHIKTSKLSLLWFGVEGEESYRIQLATHPDFLPESIIMDVIRNNTTVVTPELSNLTAYYWRVKVNNEESQWTNIWRFITTGFATIPSLTLPEDGQNNLDTDVIIFEWQEDSVNASFNLHVSTDPDFPDTIRNITVDDEKAELTNLAPGQLHYWRVKAFNSDGVPGDWSDVFSFKTKLRKPPLIAPANFSNNQDTSIIFRWSRVPTASIYDFQISQDENFEADTLIDTSLTNDRIKIDDLSNDEIYYWRLKSRNAFSDSSVWSKPFAFKTRLSKVKLLSPDFGKRNLNTTTTLQWSEGEELDFYHVQIATDTLFRDLFTNTFVESNTANIVGLENNKFYYWRINRQNSDGDSSSWSKRYNFKTKLESPELIAPANNSNKLSFDTPFEWSFIDSTDNYKFQLSESNDFSSFLLNKNIEDTLFIIDTLQTNKTFFWRVKAENDNSDSSEWSKTFNFSTSSLILSKTSIDTTINFSRNRIDTIAFVDIFNTSDETISFESVSASPDTLFNSSINQLLLTPNQNTRFWIIADTARIDTGLTNGNVNFIKSLSTNDTTKLAINLFAQKAVATFSIDELKFNRTFSSSPQTKTVRLSNRLGNISLDIDQISIEGLDEEAFKINNTFDRISAGDSLNLSITFRPIVKDTNKAMLTVKSNSYPNTIVTLPIYGIGDGSEFAESTVAELNDLSGENLKSITDSERSILFKNNGEQPIELNITFAENYFKVLNDFKLPLKLQSEDTATIKIKYLTPNFDSLNIDTLILTHNALLESPYKIPLFGEFDSSEAVQLFQNNILVDENNLEAVSDGIIVPQNSSIQSVLKEDFLENDENLEFRINYFLGGPGKKLSAAETTDNRFIIPFNSINDRGLLFNGELFTRGLGGQPIDSITIFDLIDVQVAINNYETKSINVPLSVPMDDNDEGNIKWLLFGYPFDQINSDSVFSDIGDPSKMQDGQWVVYNFDSVSDEYNLLTDSRMEAGKGYFIAQAVNESVDLSYKYENSILSRKLSDNILEVPGTGWRTISNPYTFDVEVDTPAILYRFDLFDQSFKLTNIMRPGEGYFVPPNVNTLTLINFGEYFPSVFPKIFTNADWLFELNFSTDHKTDQLYLLGRSTDGALYKSNDVRGYRKAPAISNDFKVYFSNYDQEKLSAIVSEPLKEFSIDLVLTCTHKTTLEYSTFLHKELPSGYSYAVIDQMGNKLNENESIFITNSSEKLLKLIYGTPEFISENITKIKSSVVDNFQLSQNYPNPFNPVTTITYNIPTTALSQGGQNVSLRIYDIIGREVATLVNKIQQPGIYKVDWDASKFSSGVYFYELKTDGFVETKKLILLK
jgi:hypothetical protein